MGARGDHKVGERATEKVGDSGPALTLRIGKGPARREWIASEGCGSEAVGLTLQKGGGEEGEEERRESRAAPLRSSALVQGCRGGAGRLAGPANRAHHGAMVASIARRHPVTTAGA